GYIGGLSVDIGDLYEPYGTEPSVWLSSPRQVADSTWAQIMPPYGADETRKTRRSPGIPVPRYYHLDSGLRFDAAKARMTTPTPFMIALRGQFDDRPGRVGRDEKPNVGLDSRFEYPTVKAGDEHLQFEYQVSNGNWVLCASYMPSHTRINTMEAAV